MRWPWQRLLRGQVAEKKRLLIWEPRLRHDSCELIRTTFYQAMLLTGVSSLRTHERLQRQHNNEDEEGQDHEALPSAEDFVAHATSALALVAWHIIKGLSQLQATAPPDEDEQDGTG